MGIKCRRVLEGGLWDPGNLDFLLKEAVMAHLGEIGVHVDGLDVRAAAVDQRDPISLCLIIRFTGTEMSVSFVGRRVDCLVSLAACVVSRHLRRSEDLYTLGLPTTLIRLDSGTCGVASKR